MENDIQQFVKDRNEALLSLDKDKIIVFMNKYKIPLPSPEVFWITIHKCRTASTGLRTEAREMSKEWLTQRGFQSMDDGDI